MLADRARREAAELHRRVQHGRLAPEVAAHALGGGARVGDVAVDALRGDPVPLAPLREHPAQHRAHERVARLQRRLALGPGVAERVVAVTDVDGAGIDQHAVRPRARRGDHRVVAAQVERLDRVRVERQQRPERARGRPQALQERGVDLAVREPTFGAALVVDRGEDVGVRPRVADRREHPLGAAQVQQEVVDERDAGWPSSGECKNSAPAPPSGRLASGRATPRDHPPLAPDPARRGGAVRARRSLCCRGHRRARPRRALDRRRALRDPRRRAVPGRRRGGRDRRPHLRRAQRALAVLAPDVRPRARGVAATSRRRSSTTSSSPSTSGRPRRRRRARRSGHARRRQRRASAPPRSARTASTTSSAARRSQDFARRRSATGCCPRAPRARCGGCRTRSTA